MKIWISSFNDKSVTKESLLIVNIMDHLRSSCPLLLLHNYSPVSDPEQHLLLAGGKVLVLGQLALLDGLNSLIAVLLTKSSFNR